MDIASIIIGILGTIASSIGAYIAIKEARKAKASASKAEQIRKSIIDQTNNISLTKLFSESKNIMTVTRSLTTSATPDKKLRGINYQKSIESIRKYTDVLKENAHYLPNTKKLHAEEICRGIENQLIELAKEDKQIKKYEYGDKIHEYMGKIIQIIKPELDIKTIANKL